MLVHHLLFHLTYLLASGTPAPVVPNPPAVSPISGSGVSTLLGYAKWGSLTACGASALVSGGTLAVGHHSNRPDMADKGKRALLWSLGGGVITGLAIPALNTVIAAFH